MIEARGPAPLSYRLRVLVNEPNLGLLLGDGLGAVTFPHVVERLKTLEPLTAEEREAFAARVAAYADRQVRGGALTNLRGIDVLFPLLGVADLALPPSTVEALQTWLSRLSLADLTEMKDGYKLEPEKRGTAFKSQWREDFIATWDTEGLERARRAHVAAYLTANNAWVKANGIDDPSLEWIVRAQDTLLRLSRRAPRRGGASAPSTLKQLLSVLSPAKR